jgi:lysophospholipase L1-like esterase
MKKFISRIFIVVLSLSISLLITESILAITKYSKSISVWKWVTENNEMYALDINKIYSLKNNSNPSNQEKIDQNSFRLNLTGINKRPIILMIGDSFTYGTPVENKDTYPNQVQNYLINYYIINAGIPGYGIDQEYIYIKELIKHFHPDYLVWNINLNDIWDSNQACLFKEVSPSKYIQIPGFLNTIYIEGWFIKNTPKYISNSRLLNLLIKNIKGNLARSTIGCSVDDKNYTNMQAVNEFKASFYRKLKYFSNDLKSTYNGKIIFTLVPDQIFFDYKTFNNAYWDIEELHKISDFLQKNTEYFWNYNNLLSAKYDPDLFAIRNNLTELSNNNYFTNINILGDNRVNLKKIFVENEQYGYAHPNSLGYRLMAEIFVKKFNETFR